MNLNLYLKFFRIRIVQLLLNIKKNLGNFYYLLIILGLLFITIFFGLWSDTPNYLKFFFHFIFTAIFFVYIYYLKNNINYINLNKTILWLEDKNSSSQNPILAVLDTVPANSIYDNSLWQLHKKQSIKVLKNISYFIPSISLETIDPLKCRFVFFIFLFLSFFWAYKNDRLEENIKAFLSYEEPYSKETKNLKIIAWLKPPEYTGLGQKGLDLDNLKEDQRIQAHVPKGTELFINILSNLSDFKFKEGQRIISFDKNEKNSYKLNYVLNRSQNFYIFNKNNKLIEFKFSMTVDSPPEVYFLSKPEIVNNSSIKFSSTAKDDYGIKKIEVIASKPEKFKHFDEEGITFNLNLKDETNKKEITNFFYKMFSDHIWAGSFSKISVVVYDAIDQESNVDHEIKLPKRRIEDEVAKKIVMYRQSIALKKISLDIATKAIKNIINDNENLKGDRAIEKQYEKVMNSLGKEKTVPLFASHPLYKDMWDLAIMIEDRKFYIAKKNLEQVEQNLFDSINQKETNKISPNVEKMKESLKSLLDMNKSDNNYENEINKNNNKNLTEELDKITKEIEDLLKSGSKEQVKERIQKLKQLSESFKNPNTFSDEKIREQERNDNIINKLSELLNEQEKVMEESFNMAADRGKFEQSSEGSGGKSPKEKQENLRNTLGNIMREIGASENEIPQELGRAERAMRQASRDLENGRPDRASNAQGRAVEMIQRSMNRLNSQGKNSTAKYDKNIEEKKMQEPSLDTKAEENPEYTGTSMGGIVDIPENLKVRKARKIADELYSRYRDKNRTNEEKKYIRDLLDWY